MPIDKEAELERVTQLRGFRYGLHDFYAELNVETLKELNDHVEATYIGTTTLDRKTKELALLVACISSGDVVSHLQIHMHAANKAGASPEEIMAVLDLVGRWIGNVAKVVGLEAWRATFRPDIPTIDRVVELR
ncbi:MAG: carboxymuconolactone decarboxylase family protein [Chloroflexota bacterium]|nr:carboxymuconolactone decarboxylase family protein [Chloroflexota bacterium]